MKEKCSLQKSKITVEFILNLNNNKKSANRRHFHILCLSFFV